MSTDVNATIRLRAYVRDAGQQQTAAKQLGISPQYLSDLLRGRRSFSTAVLAKLGLRRAVVAARRLGEKERGRNGA